MAGVAVVLRVQEGAGTEAGRPGFLRDLGEGWRMRRGNPTLMFMLLITFALNLSLNVLNVRAPLFAAAVGQGAGDFALIEGLFSGGALLGIVAASRLGRHLTPYAQIAGALGVFTLATLAHAVPHLPVWFAASGLAGVSIGLLDVGSVTQMQALVPDGLRGRMTGIAISVGALGLTLGAAVAGLPWSTTLLMTVLGGILALLSLGWVARGRRGRGVPLTEPA